MERRTEVIRLRSGEVLTMHFVNGESVCPVCGFLVSGEPPYGMYQSRSDADEEWGEPFGAASFDICPSCSVHFGVDDWVDGVPVATMWEKLRREWLDEIGWPEDALQRLKQNLQL